MSRRYSRRRFLRAAALGGSGLLAAQLIGCDGGGEPPAPATASPAASAPTGGATGPTESPAALAWRQILLAGESPPARRDHSLVGDGQRLYLFGGRNPAPLDDVWVYDLASANWSALTSGDGPAARFGHNAVFDPSRGRMLLFGGQGGAGGFFNDLWAFDFAGGWSQLAATGGPPSTRYGAAAAFDPAGRLLVTHGFTDAGRFDDTWSLGLGGDIWTDVSPAGARPVERCLMRAAWDSGAAQLLMFGGQTTGTPFLGDLWSFDGAAWREIAADPRPSPRNFYALAFDEASRRLFLFGGNSAAGPLNDLWFFDPAAERWSQAGPEGAAPPPRAGHDAVWLPDSRRLIVFGGATASGDAADLWELSVPA